MIITDFLPKKIQLPVVGQLFFGCVGYLLLLDRLVCTCNTKNSWKSTPEVW